MPLAAVNQKKPVLNSENPLDFIMYLILVAVYYFRTTNSAKVLAIFVALYIIWAKILKKQTESIDGMEVPLRLKNYDLSLD